jgi:hypothetical protein
VDCALVWQSEPGRLAALPNLRLILSSAAAATPPGQRIATAAALFHVRFMCRRSREARANQ